MIQRSDPGIRYWSDTRTNKASLNIGDKGVNLSDRYISFSSMLVFALEELREYGRSKLQ